MTWENRKNSLLKITTKWNFLSHWIKRKDIHVRWTSVPEIVGIGLAPHISQLCKVQSPQFWRGGWIIIEVSVRLALAFQNFWLSIFRILLRLPLKKISSASPSAALLWIFSWRAMYEATDYNTSFCEPWLLLRYPKGLLTFSRPPLFVRVSFSSTMVK